MPGNKDNLIISMRDRTPEERRESARIAGIASGVARRKKKSSEEKFKLAIEYFTNKMKDRAREDKNHELAKYIEETGAEVFEISKIAFDEEHRVETRLKALDMITERVHGRVKERPFDEDQEEITEPKFI